MSNDKKYYSASQQRILRVLFALAGHETNGVEPGEIAKALVVTPDKVTRDLSNLSIAGLAERMDNGRWRLTPKLSQIGIAMLNNIERSQTKLTELKNRYTRTPY